ncbi:MAG: alpha/beta hydrolase [Pseudomonadota bacterium]
MKYIKVTALTIFFVGIGIPLLGLGYQAVGLAGDAAIRKQINAPGEIISVGDFSMHIHCSGPAETGAPTVILEAGNSEWSSAWAHVQADLEKSIRVCSYDRQGYAWSDASNDAVTAANAVQHLNSLLEESGERGPFIVVAHSLGYVFARRYAYEFTDQVAGLVVIDGGPPGRYSTYTNELRKAFADSEAVYGRLEPLARFGVLRATGLMSNPMKDLPKDAYLAVKAFGAEEKTARAIAREYVRMDNLYSEAAAMASLGAIPLTVISADNSYPDLPALTVTMLKYNEELARSFSSNGRHVMIEGVDHFGLLSNRQAARQIAEEVRLTSRRIDNHDE